MINWRNIRVHNNSQNNAFEELVCQLARRSNLGNKNKFVRLGSPDGGVECYLELTDATEIGWQAKYVFSIDDLLSQVDKSIRTAIKNHPAMVKYIVATPFNLPDPHYTGSKGRPVKSAKIKWSEKVDSWVSEFSTEERKFEVELWDESQLNDLLIVPQNEGLRYYWFMGDEFTSDSFMINLNSSIADLGPRYTPELNITVQTSSHLDYLFRNERPFKIIQKYNFDLRIAAEEVLTILKGTKHFIDLSVEYTNLSNVLNEIYQLLDLSSYSEMQELKINELMTYLEVIDQILLSIWNQIENDLKDTEFRNSTYERNLNKMLQIIDEGRNLFSHHAKLINYPFMILHGEPGIGKSHLLADVCLNQMKKGIPAILLLGDQFSDSTNPREFIKQRMEYSGNFSSLLQLINSIGQTYDQRIIIAIDALNEGDGNNIWLKYLAGLESEIKNFPWIAFVVSVRTDYVEDIIPDSCKKSMLFIEHQGFDEAYDFACEHFFEYYGLNIGTPTFNSEFNNPLFLKLFCESCKNIDYVHNQPSLPQILDGFVEHINNKIYRKLRYDKSLELVKVAMSELAEALVKTNTHSVSYSEIKIKIDEAVSHHLGITSTTEYFSFFDALIKEGIFRAFSGYQGREKKVGFAYDRMKDYYILLYWLEQKPESTEIMEYLKSITFFEKVWKSNGYGYNTLLELLAVILPERYKKEIIECVPNGKITQSILKAQLKSFHWRIEIESAEKIGKWLIDISKENLELKTMIIDELLGIASVAGHYFNIEFIVNNFLHLESMAQLDEWWTPHINQKYEEFRNNIYKRIVKWCWRTDRKDTIDSNTRYLLGLTLSWFCSSSNRALRDNSTKGLTCLYLHHVDELPKLLSIMEDVKDIYIIERLLAAAYGSAVYTTEKVQVKILSDYILDNYFNKIPVYPNILVRDYARGIVAYSIHCQNYNTEKLEVIRSKITPPYGSCMPQKIPTDDEIKMIKERYDGVYGFSLIISSMKTDQNYGDFGRYTFKSALNDFAGVDIGSLENWCLLRIIELGYDPQIHDKHKVHYGGRESNRVERIGKKYQWITFHEILALVADNYLLKGENWWQDKSCGSYSGPWEPNVRDIDPTLLISEKKGLDYQQPPKSWLNNYEYLPVEQDGAEWIMEEVDCEEELLLKSDSEGVEWVALCSYPFWNEYPADFNRDRNSETKSMRAYIFSYITSDRNVCDFDIRQLKEMNWYNVYAGEYYWSTAYESNRELHGALNWENVALSDGENANIMQTTQRYIWENGTDFSKSDTIAYDIPTEFLFASMGLQLSPMPGYYHVDNEIVCMNPTIFNESNHQLLIRKDFLCEWLKKNNLKIHWRIKIEKYLSEGVTHNTKKWSDYEGWKYFDGVKIVGNINRIAGSD